MEPLRLVSKQLPSVTPDHWTEFPSRLPSCDSCHNIASPPSRGNTPRQDASASDEDWTKLFEERPRDFGDKAAWLSNLELKRGKEWYERFFRWYLQRLHPLPRGNFPISQPNFQNSVTKLQPDPENTAMKFVTGRLAHASVSDTPDYLLGQYNGHTLGLVLNGSALDPPTMGTKIFDQLSLQYAHLKMFVGLRVQEWAKGDLCLLTLGNVYASTKESTTNNTSTTSEPTIDPSCGTLGEDLDWVDTRFVLAMNTASFHPAQLFLIYKYEVYGVEYLDDGDEARDEEPEQKSPPKFCDGPIAFTVAIWERPERSIIFEFSDRTSLRDTDLHVVSTKKPMLAEAGYKNKRYPYVPVFPPRDS